MTETSVSDLRREIDDLRAVTKALWARVSVLEVHISKLAPPVKTAGAEWLTMKQAAYELGMTQSGVRYYIDSGDLVSAKFGSTRRVRADSLSNFQLLKVRGTG